MSDLSRESLAAVIASVELRDVRLVAADVRTHVRDVRAISNPTLTMKHGTKVISRTENGFIVGAKLSAQIMSSGATESDENAPISMVVTFALKYRLDNAASVDESVLGEFARVNGAFNAWPYWREYVQTTAARMSLPPIVLPVFRVERPKTGRIERPVPAGGTVEASLPAPAKSSTVATARSSVVGGKKK